MLISADSGGQRHHVLLCWAVQVNQAFSGKRKTLRNSLQGPYEPDSVESACEEAGIPADARAQNLTLEEMLLLFKHLPPPKKNSTNWRHMKLKALAPTEVKQ